VNEPLTDEQLTTAEQLWKDMGCAAFHAQLLAEVRRLRQLYKVADTQLERFRSGAQVDEMAQTIAQLTAENERLRSDEWLWKAAQEIANHRTDEDNGEFAFGILRKHRDGA
jgi:hypothetical protein